MDIVHLITVKLSTKGFIIEILIDSTIIYKYSHIIDENNYAVDLPYLVKLYESISKNVNCISPNVFEHENNIKNSISYYEGYLYFKMNHGTYSKYKILVNDKNKNNVSNELSKIISFGNPFIQNELPNYVEISV